MMKSIGEDENGNDIKVRDSEGIQLANATIDEIRNGFTEWLEDQPVCFSSSSFSRWNSFIKYSSNSTETQLANLKAISLWA